MAIANETKSINSQCQIVILPWEFNTLTEDLSIANLTSTLPLLDVSKELVSVSFTKSLAEPAGNFEFELPNSRDWSEFIQAGTWCLIYMSQDGDLAIPKQGTDGVTVSQLKDQSSKLRCIGYIERVSPKGTIGQDLGEFDIAFTITGRDFGVVYEETEIWHNVIKYEAALIDAATAFLNSSTIKTVDGLLDTIHKLFYSPVDLPGISSRLTDFSLAQSALQWLLPSVMIQALNLKVKNSTPFYGNIEGLLVFDKSDASFPVENPLTYLNGNAWSQLKSKSLEPFHELFTETDDEGKPHLNFRPIPWRLTKNSKLGPLEKSVGLFGEIDRVVLPAIDILDFDIAKDNHNRFNLFYAIPRTSLYTAEDNISAIGNNFPRLLQNSIHRHGLRLMFTELNATINFGKESLNNGLLKNYNELNFDYWNNAIFLQSGTLDIIGNNGIKLGKVLEIEKGAPYNSTKLLYIEGYTDSYEVNEEGAGFWTQSLILTRGIEKAVLESLSNITQRQEDFEEEGEFTEGN